MRSVRDGLLERWERLLVKLSSGKHEWQAGPFGIQHCVKCGFVEPLEADARDYDWGCIVVEREDTEQ